MSVYVGKSEWPYRGQLYCHMVADTLEELHKMAERIGMRRDWFQCPPKASRPHYDLAPSKRAAAVLLGAIEAPRKIECEMARKLHAEWLEIDR